jgi:hypothetical protein
METASTRATQGNRKIATEAAAALHVQNGGRGEVISLPE